VQENKPLVDKDSKFARKQNYSDFALESWVKKIVILIL
jgi:hypothetical protein